VVVPCPGVAAEELSTEGEDDENITRHSYVQRGGIGNLAGASCISQTCAGAELGRFGLLAVTTGCCCFTANL
jgi:hypothetical protein